MRDLLAPISETLDLAPESFTGVVDNASDNPSWLLWSALLSLYNNP